MTFLRRHAAVAELILVAALAIASAFWLHRVSLGQRFTIDESRWITTSRYFWTTFLERDIFGPAWQPNYIVLTHPPVARYILGFGLWLQGWTPDQFNGRYDSLQSRAFNERAGNIPSPELLAAARRVSLVIAVAAMLLVYCIGRTLAGPLAGLLAFALAVANPLLSQSWTSALAEAPLAFFSLLTLLLALRVVPRFPLERVSGAGPLGVGVALGLASATKLTGVLGGLALALFAGLQQALEWRRRRRFAGLGRWLDVVLAAALVFVVVNPLLYPNPVARTLLLFEQRREEMQQQRRIWTAQAVPDDPWARVQRVGRRVFQSYTTFRGAVPPPVEGALVVAGLGVALAATRRDLVARRAAGPFALLLCWAVTAYVGVTANLGFDEWRYYAPLVTVNAILEALALTAAASWLGRRVLRLRRARRPALAEATASLAPRPAPGGLDVPGPSVG